MRTFNIYGPVDPAEHYHVLRQPLLDQMVAQIEKGKYFSIYAPRQTGKTTFIRDVRTALGKDSRWTALSLSFEGYGGLEAVRFYERLQAALLRQLATLYPDNGWAFPPPQDQTDFTQLAQSLPARRPDLRLVLLVDEFDALEPALARQFLHTLRNLYLTGKDFPHALHSVALISLKNIVEVGLGGGSPFNIAYKIALPPFTQAEVADLLGQYTAESGQPFAPGVIETLHMLTGGHPFLVNRLAGILTAELGVAPPQPLTAEQLERAYRRLVQETNDNFITLFHRTDPLRELVQTILFGGSLEFNLAREDLYQLHLNGVIRNEDGYCEIANPIYKGVLIRRYRPADSPGHAEHIANGIDFRRYLHAGRLDMLAVLSDFAQFVVRRGAAAFRVTDQPQEATGQYLLLAYLDLLMRQLGGQAFVEVPTGQGRMDIIALYVKQRHVIETKIWRGPIAFEQGQAQLADYLKSEGLSEGYYVVFQARPDRYGKLPFAETAFDAQVAGCTIHNVVVRLFPEPRGE